MSKVVHALSWPVFLILAATCSGCSSIFGSVQHGENDDGLEACTAHSECTVAVRIDRCCDCPAVYAARLVEESPYLIFYTPGMRYGHLLPARCAGVDCDACPLPPEPACGGDKICRPAE
jgi:hypothetical protein